MDRPGEVVVKEYGSDITNLVSDLHQAKRIQKIQYALHITENEFLKHVVCTWLHLKPIDYIKQRAWVYSMERFTTELTNITESTKYAWYFRIRNYLLREKNYVFHVGDSGCIHVYPTILPEINISRLPDAR